MDGGLTNIVHRTVFGGWGGFQVFWTIKLRAEGELNIQLQTEKELDEREVGRKSALWSYVPLSPDLWYAT